MEKGSSKNEELDTSQIKSDFLGNLSVYLLIWLTVSYVGVYVTCMAGPILLVSGFILWVTMPCNKVR